MVWFWAIIATIIALILAFLCLVCWFVGRRAKVDVQMREEEVPPKRLGVPSILPSGGKHPAGTPLVVVPPPDASVYYRIGQPTTVHMAKFERLDGQVIVLGAPHPCNIPNTHSNIPHVTGSVVVQAFSYAPGREDSDIMTSMLEITPPTGEVFFSHAPGVYEEGLFLTLWHPETGNLFYTVTGEDPWDAGLPYESPILITETTEVRAAAQGSRTPAMVKRYVIPKKLEPPLVLVSGEACPRDKADVDPSDSVAFSHRIDDRSPGTSCPTVLYSVEKAEDGKYLEWNNTVPTSIFTSAIAFTPGEWVLKAVSTKPEWKDSDPLSIRVRCAPSVPAIVEKGTVPKVVTITGDGIIRYKLDCGGVVEERSGPSPVNLTLERPGLYVVEANATDPVTQLMSKPTKLPVHVENRIVNPVSLHPPAGQFVVTDSFPITINLGGETTSVRVNINDTERPYNIGEELHLRGFGRSCVTAVATSGNVESTPVTQVYRLVPAVPKVTPGGGSYGIDTLCRIQRPVLPHWAGQVELHYSYTFQPKNHEIEPMQKSDTIKGDTTFRLPHPGRYEVVAWCFVKAGGEVVKSDIVEVVYEVTENGPAPPTSPVTQTKFTHAPTFYPIQGTHVGHELQVYLSCADDGDIYYGINREPDIDKVYPPNSAIILRHKEMSAGKATITAYAKVVGKQPSRVVSKTYQLELPFAPTLPPTPVSVSPRSIGAAQPTKPSLTCHAVQLMVELQIPDEDGLSALYTLDRSMPMAQPGGSTLELSRTHSIPIPRKGTTELQAICVDTKGRRAPSRVVSKTFIEGAPYLPVSKGAGHEQSTGDLPPPKMIAHARVIVVVATADDPSWIIRYTMGGDAPDTSSPLFPSSGLQIAIQHGKRPGVLRVATFDATNTMRSEEVVQDFTSIDGTNPPPDPVPAHSLAPSPSPSTMRTETATTQQNQQTQSTPSLQPLRPNTAPPAAAAPAPSHPPITSSSFVPDSFSRGVEAAKQRANRRAAVLAELKRQEQELHAKK